MIYKNENTFVKRIIIECDDQCSSINITQYKDEPGFAFIDFSESTFSSYQQVFWTKIKRYFKRLWSAITGKEYLFQEVAIQSQSIKELKSAILDLKE